MDNSSPTCGTSQSAATLVFTNADSMLGLAALSADGRIKIYARAQADIIIDVVGYYGETTDTWNY